MAAASSSSSSSNHYDSSSYSGKWEYDVFLCFRGADTRDGFTSHLMAAFSREKINAFIDEDLPKTESINDLISILKRSALSIVIFSENFADSTWCLDEVATISQSMLEFGHRVLPVFYKVDPSDVTEDSRSYAATIEEKHGASKSPEDMTRWMDALKLLATISQSIVEFGHWVLQVFCKVDPSDVAEDSRSYAATAEEKHVASKSPADMKRWMDALKLVAKSAGRTSQATKDDAELVKQVVEDVRSKLAAMSSSIHSSNLVGMDSRVLDLEGRLAMNKTDSIRIVGLRGMGGVGKTTLARTCYEKLKFSTKDTEFYFVDRIGDYYDTPNGVEGLVLKLYSALLSEEKLELEDLNIGYRRARLSRTKVFVVLDDVRTHLQLEQLLLGNALNPSKLFAAGSRVIVTTRDQQVLEYAKAEMHLVEGLNDGESLRLFKCYAFESISSLDHRVDLSSQVVSYCTGNPLALRVLGGSLLCKDIEYWESFLCKLGEIQQPGILNVLRKSYDWLGDDDRRLFLDVACFIDGNKRSVLTKALETSYTSAHSRVQDLIDKSMLICELDKNNHQLILVHDLLKEMAWNVVNEETDVGKRSWVRNYDDVVNLLTVWKGYKATRGIGLSNFSCKTLKANAFEGMASLRFLYSFNFGLRVANGGLDILPDSLSWLQWHMFPSKSLPSAFSAENLVVLHLLYSSKLERCWEVEPKLVNLVELNLTFCENLVAIPNLSRSSNMEYLFLAGCKSLIELPSHVGDLDKLIELDINGCTNLNSLPVKLNSKFLKIFCLSRCPNVTHCPEIISRELGILDLMETPIEALPSAIHNIKQDGSVRLCGKHIASFPAISASLELFCLCHTTITEMDCYDDDQQQGSLPIFVRLELRCNPQLKSLSRNIWNMVSKVLILQECPSIETLPEISQLVNSFTRLLIAGCRNLKSLPTGINNLKYLEVLCCDDTDIKSLPACILEFDKLSYLSLERCSRIEFLPELPPNLLTLAVSGCTSLQALPSNISSLKWEGLYFKDCPRLDRKLPIEIVHNFPNHVVRNLPPQVVLQYSGSEIPEWFAYKRLNYESDSCMVVQLHPPNCTNKRLIKGITFGVVCSSDIGFLDISITCVCNIDTTGTTYRSSSDFGFGLTQSDNVYIWYEKNLLGKTKKGIQETEPWYERYAEHTVSFRFSLQPIREKYHERLKSIKIKGIGVSLLY